MLIERRRIMFAPDGAAAGGGQQQDQQQQSSGQDTAAGTDTQDGQDDEGDGLFGQVEKDTPAPDKDGKAQRPAFLAEQFWDAEKGAVRLEELAKSQKDLRAMIARGEHKPPPTPEAYQVPTVEGVQDPLALMGGKEDPLWKDVRTAAHQAGVSQAQMAAILSPVLAAVAKKGAGTDGKQASPEDEAAAAEARAEQMRAELGKLGPNGKLVVQQTGAWLAGLESRGIMTKAEVKALRSISTAEGVRALAKLREMRGEQGIPTDALSADGEMTQADAQKLLTEGFATGNEEKIAKGRAALAKLDKAGLLKRPGER